MYDICPETVAFGIVDIDGCLIDEDGDGVILSLAYDENGELEKTFSSVDEFYEDTIEVELEENEENNCSL